jgi:hypothetical protein
MFRILILFTIYTTPKKFLDLEKAGNRGHDAASCPPVSSENTFSHVDSSGIKVRAYLLREPEKAI